MGERQQTESSQHVEAIAAEAFEVLGTGRQVAPFASRHRGFDLDDAYAVAARVKEMRATRGETAIGRKIGFTNADVQRFYGVAAPIWNYMFDRTVRDVGRRGELDLSGLSEPLIEPEIALHLAAAPEPAMDDVELLACVDWVAHGCEIVQSIFPGWKFEAADSVAGYGLHGAYLVGERRPVAGDRAGWAEALSSFTIEISSDAGVVRHGRAANVLGGPLKALRHLVRELSLSSPREPLRPGELVTTGTLTDAMPVAAGQTWTTRLSGIDLPGIEVRFR